MPQNRRRTGAQNPIVGSEATRWRPGQSGNPGGRPRTAAYSQACREVLSQRVPDDPEGRTYAQMIAEALAQRALKGDIRAAQELADRAEGRSSQSVEVAVSAFRGAFERMSNEELQTYAESGEAPGWFQALQGATNETTE